MFNAHSDHAFFYDRSAGQAIAKMKVVEPKRIRPYRLAMHPSDTSQFRRASFDEMREFTPEGLQAAIEAREAVTFHAQDMDAVELELRQRRLQATPMLKDHRTIKGYRIRLPK